jgi:hypothetical protein
MAFSFRAARRSPSVLLGSSAMESSSQAGDVASSSTLAEGGESMHALILAVREGEGLLCSEESDGVRRSHHYMQLDEPFAAGRGRGERVTRSRGALIAGGGGLGARGRRRESWAGDGAIII